MELDGYASGNCLFIKSLQVGEYARLMLLKTFFFLQEKETIWEKSMIVGSGTMRQYNTNTILNLVVLVVKLLKISFLFFLPFLSFKQAIMQAFSSINQ
jgi:hypothetical protein